MERLSTGSYLEIPFQLVDIYIYICIDIDIDR